MANTTPSPETTGVGAAHLSRFGELRGALPGDRLDWLRARRESALKRFESLGVPTPKREEWKFTNLRILDKAGLEPAAVGPAPALMSCQRFCPTI